MVISVQDTHKSGHSTIKYPARKKGLYLPRDQKEGAHYHSAGGVLSLLFGKMPRFSASRQ